MAIRELKFASVNEFASVVSRDYDNIEEELFETDGSPKNWRSPNRFDGSGRHAGGSRKRTTATG